MMTSLPAALPSALPGAASGSATTAASTPGAIAAGDSAPPGAFARMLERHRADPGAEARTDTRAVRRIDAAADLPPADEADAITGTDDDPAAPLGAATAADPTTLPLPSAPDAAAAAAATAAPLPGAVPATAGAAARAPGNVDRPDSRAAAPGSAAEPALPSAAMAAAVATPPGPAMPSGSARPGEAVVEPRRGHAADPAHAAGVGLASPTATPTAVPAIGSFAALLAEHRKDAGDAQPAVGDAGPAAPAAAIAGAAGLSPAGLRDAGPAPAAAVTVHTPLDAPGFGREFGLQVSVLARGGVQQAELRLNPAEMGPVSVQIALDGTQARIDFGADLAATRDVLQASLPALAAALRDAGLTLAGGGVSQHGGGARDRDTASTPGDGPFAGRGERGDAPRATAVVRRTARAGGVDLYA
jgi:hypothetical protein